MRADDDNVQVGLSNGHFSLSSKLPSLVYGLLMRPIVDSRVSKALRTQVSVRQRMRRQPEC